MKIKIDTDYVRQVSQQLRAEADHLAETGAELQGAINSLDTWAWEGVSRARAESLLSQTRPRGNRLAREMEDFGRQLQRVAEAFDQQDSTAARKLAGMPWVDWDTHSSGKRANLKMNDDRFISGPSLTDIQQGALGDCYLIAGMGAVAYSRPELIERAIRPNEDGTYTITFYDDAGNEVEITVSPNFPKNKGQDFAKSTEEGELWVSLVEKAYVQWQTGGTSANHYEKIAGGDPGDVMAALTGEPINTLNIRRSSAEDIGRDLRQALEDGDPTTVGIKPTGGQALNSAFDILVPDSWVDRTHGNSPDLVGNHAYVVKSVEGDQVTLYNPWGVGQGAGPGGREEFTISLDDLKRYASDIDICDIGG